MPKFGEAWDLAQPKKRANTKPAASSPRLTVGRRVLQHDWASFAVRAVDGKAIVRSNNGRRLLEEPKVC